MCITRRDAESASGQAQGCGNPHLRRERRNCSDSGGGIARALDHFKGEPFFTHNSDSVWVEGTGHALDRLTARWNPDAMDALMLLAPTVTVDRLRWPRRFQHGCGRAAFARARAARGAVRVDGRADRASAPLRRTDERKILDQSAVGSRHRQRRGFTACASTACGCISTRPEAVNDAEDFLADLAPA